MGADVCTCPASVIEALFKHPLTDIGLERFLKDWEKCSSSSPSDRGRTTGRGVTARPRSRSHLEA